MAQIIKINSMTKSDKNNIGDVVGVVEDSHKFDPNEEIQFDIEKVPETKIQVMAQMKPFIPEKKTYYKNSVSGEFEEMKEIPKYQVNRKDGQFLDNTLSVNTAVKSG